VHYVLPGALSCGESGRKINMTMPQAEHSAPLKKVSKMAVPRTGGKFPPVLGTAILLTFFSGALCSAWGIVMFIFLPDYKHDNAPGRT
jgi:hypothetical protein